MVDLLVIRIDPGILERIKQRLRPAVNVETPPIRRHNLYGHFKPPLDARRPLLDNGPRNCVHEGVVLGRLAAAAEAVCAHVIESGRDW